MDGRVVEESPLPSYPTAHDPFLGQACTLLSHFSPKVAHGHASDPFCRCEMSSARSPSTPTPRLERRSPSRPRCADILLQQRPWYATYSRACLAPLFARATHERLHPHVSALRLTDVSASRRSQADASVFTAALFASSAAAPRRSDADADADSSGSRREQTAAYSGHLLFRSFLRTRFVGGVGDGFCGSAGVSVLRSALFPQDAWCVATDREIFVLVLHICIAFMLCTVSLPLAGFVGALCKRGLFCARFGMHLDY